MTKILYILGRGRGGSTVLANVLGEVEGFFAAGEVRYLWDPVLVNDALCGCERPLRECEIWSKVLADLSDVDLGQVVAWQRDVVRESKVFKILRTSSTRRWEALEAYTAVAERLYESIARVTGCRVIVDSSKRPSYAALVHRLQGCEAYFVHLVRDPRASAYSWQTRRYVSARHTEVRQRNAFDSTIRWDLLNLGSEAVLRSAGKDRSLRIRYEDFVADPQRAVKEIGALVGESEMTTPFVDSTTVMLKPNHTIAGNPSRYRTGRMEIRDKAEWRSAQGPVSRWTSTVTALPLLRRYGYRVRSSAENLPTRPRT